MVRKACIALSSSHPFAFCRANYCSTVSDWDVSGSQRRHSHHFRAQLILPSARRSMRRIGSDARLSWNLLWAIKVRADRDSELMRTRLLCPLLHGHSRLITAINSPTRSASNFLAALHRRALAVVIASSELRCDECLGVETHATFPSHSAID